MGLCAYRLALRLFFGESPSPGDWRAVIVWSAIAFFPVAFVVCIPALASVDSRRLRGSRLLVLPATGGSAAAVASTFTTAGCWGGRVWSPESALFAVLFAVSGATFGLAYALISNRL
jgi:hypothetical protein